MTCDYNKELDRGQIILKGVLVSSNFPKTMNEQMNSFLLLRDVFLFVFWENPRHDWFAFEIN